MKQHARAVPLLTAFALSVLAHAIALSGGWLRLPQTPADPPPLIVRLEPLTPPARALVRRAPTAKPADTPRAPPLVAAPAIAISDADLMAEAYALGAATGVCACPEGGACLAAEWLEIGDSATWATRPANSGRFPERHLAARPSTR